MISYLMRFAVNVAPLVLREGERAIRLLSCLNVERFYARAEFSLQLLVLETK